MPLVPGPPLQNASGIIEMTGLGCQQERQQAIVDRFAVHTTIVTRADAIVCSLVDMAGR